jgi:hypothetical protein
MVIALAGRRIDASGAETPRFPLSNVGVVRQSLRELFETRRAKALVSAAACGADLNALSEAGALGMRRRVVLPFDRNRFRATSVTDRPGEWGPIYDQILDEVSSKGDLVTLEGDANDSQAYSAANLAILNEAVALARQSNQPLMAVLVWDGERRGEDDLTEAFGDEARRRGLQVLEVRTI